MKRWRRNTVDVWAGSRCRRGARGSGRIPRPFNPSHGLGRGRRIVVEKIRDGRDSHPAAGVQRHSHSGMHRAWSFPPFAL